MAPIGPRRARESRMAARMAAGWLASAGKAAASTPLARSARAPSSSRDAVRPTSATENPSRPNLPATALETPGPNPTTTMVFDITPLLLAERFDLTREASEARRMRRCFAVSSTASDSVSVAWSKAGSAAMKIKSLGHVVLQVTDCERAEAFYNGLLGLPVCARLDQGGNRMTFFTLGNHHDFAVMQVSGDGAGRRASQPGLHHVAFKIGDSLDELREAKAKLDGAGVKTTPIDHEVTK